ncbi:MAG: hypothetical protein COR54_12960 [Elusimicrobia bacterium CG22_combo_CG10-13_8_21_14_all_63_91]|nr:MAG: hypothetical protein COR54_12960 [Elusimicrobia bacterium CG22_combo_CG10-13_8_21_14_all_63_91]
MSLAFAALITPALCSAKAMPKRVPGVGDGVGVGVDPYVEEFEREMAATKRDLAAIRTSILAVQIPPGTQSGALLAGLKAAQEYAAITAVVTRAEAAHSKFIAHVMGWDPSDDVDAKLNLSGPAFDEKKDDKNLRQKRDNTLRGAKTGSTAQRSALGPQQALSRASGGGGSQPQMQLQTTSSKFSYANTGGGLESDFGGMTLNNSITATGAVGQGESGVDSASGVAAPAGAVSGTSSLSSSGADAQVANSKSAAELSQNTSDVAQKAFERMQARQEEAMRQAKEKENSKSQRQQQMAQAMQQALGQAGQAMQGAQKQAGGCKNCNKGKQQESQQKAQAAPAGS